MAKYVDIIKTQRLYLRGIDETDTEMIVKWRSDPEAYKYFKNPHKITREEHLEWFNNSYNINEDRFDWMCIEQETGERIGVFGLIRDKKEVEVNYILDKGAQHKGYAIEAIIGLIEYARAKWYTRRITAEVHRDNTASIGLIRKLGFTHTSSNDSFDTYCLELE